MFETVLKQVIKNVGKPEYTAVDAGYKTPYNCKILIDQEIRLVMPYTRPMTKEGFFKKYEYVYDEYYDCYICPNNQILSYRTTNREGYREYKSDPQVCRSCPYRSRCTNSKDYTKLVTRHSTLFQKLFYFMKKHGFRFWRKPYLSAICNTAKICGVFPFL